MIVGSSSKPHTCEMSTSHQMKVKSSCESDSVMVSTPPLYTTIFPPKATLVVARLEQMRLIARAVVTLTHSRAYFHISFFFTPNAVLGSVLLVWGVIHVHAFFTFLSLFLFLFLFFAKLSIFLHKFFRFRSLFGTSYVKKLLVMLFANFSI